MKLSARLNLALKRAAGILLATVKWTGQDIIEYGGNALISLVELVGNVLWLVFTIMIGPVLMFRKAWGVRKNITEKTKWTKRKSPPPSDHEIL